MKDEIKEILNYVNTYRYNKECKELVVEDVLTIEEAYKLIDYITNLQEENERLKNIINELEKDLIIIREKTFTKYHANEWDNCLSFNEDIKPMLDKLKELKEDK